MMSLILVRSFGGGGSGGDPYVLSYLSIRDITSSLLVLLN